MKINKKMSEKYSEKDLVISLCTKFYLKHAVCNCFFDFQLDGFSF